MTVNTIQVIQQQLLQNHYVSCHNRLTCPIHCVKVTKKGKLNLYYVTVALELQAPGMQKRVTYCRWFQTFVAQNLNFLDMMSFSEEAQLHLSGYVNSENMCVGCCRPSYHSRGVHPWKKEVWYTHTHPHKWPIPFHTTVNANIYLNSFQESTSYMDDRELPFGYFQEDGATYHTPERPWKKSRVFLGRGLSWKDSGCTDLQTWLCWLFSVGSAEGKEGVLKMNIALLRTWKETLPTKVMQSFLLFLLQHNQKKSVVLTCLFKRRKTNFSIFCNSIISTFMSCTSQVSF